VSHYPSEKNDARSQKSHRRKQQRWQFPYTDPNGQKRRTPYEINDGERQQSLPSRVIGVGLHGSLLFCTLSAVPPCRAIIPFGGSRQSRPSEPFRLGFEYEHF
jgi:hypothetical protein